MKYSRKRVVAVLVAIALVFSIMPVAPITAQAASQSDLTFELNADGVSYSVTGCRESASGTLSIPATYNGKPVTSIGDAAFFYCSQLTGVTIPKSVVSIGHSAFSYCSKLTSITIPGSVTSIGDSAFISCSGLTSVTISEGVTSIGNCAFQSCTALTRVSIPNSITSIGDSAFYYCRNLTGVLFPESVNSIIGNRAFYGCYKLSSIVIPEGVTSIGDSAFSACSNLTNVTLPASLISIGIDVFNDCTKLSNVQMNENNNIYSIDSKGVLFNKDKTELLYALSKNINGAYSVPDSVTSIGKRAFYGCNALTGITIPEGVVSVADYAFASCSNLTSAVFPASLASIGIGIFDDCGKLSNVQMSENNMNYSIDNKCVLYNKDKTVLIYALSRKISGSYSIPNSVTRIGDRAFYNCTVLTGIAIPESVTNIGKLAFYNCTGLTNIIVPEGVTNIGYRAFAFCSNLTKITIPNSITSIGDATFEYCTSLSYNNYHNAEYLGNGDNPYLVLVSVDPGITAYQISQHTKIIMDLAFYDCKDLTGITIPDNVTCIGAGAFNRCTSLSNIQVSDNNAYYSSGAQGELFSKNKTKLICVPSKGISGAYSVPNSVTSIGDYTFYYCSNLTSVTIPNSVIEIGPYAFYACNKLTSIVIPENLLTVGNSAFDYCNSLTHVWYGGSKNDRNDIAVEAFGNSCFNDATWHYNCCDSDSHIYDKACDPVCNICGFVGIAAEHSYTNSCDTTCDVCGYLRTIMHNYDNSCDTTCNVCGDIRAITHSYDNSCDTTCNVCGDIRAITHSYDNDCDTSCNVCSHSRTTQHVYDNADDLTCNVCKYSLRPSAPILLTNGPDTIVLKEQIGLEYSKDGISWQKSNVFTGLSHLKTYTFYQRVARSQNASVSEASPGLTVTTIDKYVPDIPQDFTFVEITDTSVRLNAVAGCEYSIDGRNWQTSPVFTNLTPGTRYTFYQRTAEDSKYYASPNAVLHVTTYSKLGTITYDSNGGQNTPGVTTGKISTQTPTRSGYKFVGWALTPDTYAVYKPGDNYSHQEDIILYATWAKECDICNGMVDYTARCPWCLGTGDSFVPCSYCEGTGSSYKDESCPVDFCYDGYLILNGSYVGICATCEGDGIVRMPCDCSKCYGSGKKEIDCNTCNGDGLVSKTCTQCTSGVPIFTPEAPQVPELQSVSNNTVVLVAYSTCEYSVGGSNWQDSNVFTNLKANTQYVFYQRYKGTTHTNHSNASPALRVTTLKESVLPPQPPVLQNKTFNKVILERVDGCEYSIDGINWQSNNVFDDLHPSTNYTFYCRFAETATHLYSAASEGLTVLTEDSPLFNVVFVDWNGTVISADTYRWGDEITVPANPTKAADNTYTYTFAGWDKEVVACAGDAIYTATYTSTYINYTVVFKDWNGKILSTKTYHWSDKVTAPADPTKVADNTYTYAFAGWDKAVVNCAGDATYTATYTSAYIDYTIVFKNWNGTVLSTSAYHFGDIVTVPANPSRPSDDSYIYTFTGWDKTVVACNGDATYTAVYSSQTRVPSAITSSTYTVSGATISKISTGTTVSTLVGKLNEGQYVKVYNGSQEVSGSTLIGTGMVIKIMDDNTAKATYTIVVTGDTNGDGKITVTDMLAVKAHVLKKSTLTGASAQAADTSGDNAISITDFIQMKAQILGKSNVEPRAINASTQQLSTASVLSRPSTAVVTTEYTATNVTLPESKTVSTLNYTQVVAIVPDKKSLVSL